MLQGKEKKGKGVYRAEVVDISACVVVAALASENEIPTLFYMPQEEVKEKAICVGAVVEVENCKILRVLTEKQGVGK